jgi:hypothetical protein
MADTERYQDLKSKKTRRTTMRKSIIATLLAVTMFYGAVIADDGNMGAGGYTGCDGSNPPPTCECNVTNPPDSCNLVGFAADQGTEQSSNTVGYSDMVELVAETLLAVR